MSSSGKRKALIGRSTVPGFVPAVQKQTLDGETSLVASIGRWTVPGFVPAVQKQTLSGETSLVASIGRWTVPGFVPAVRKQTLDGETALVASIGRWTVPGLLLAGWKQTLAGEGTNPEGDYEGWRAVLPPWPVAGAPEVPEAGEPALSVYPNPVRGRATVRLTVPAASHARVEVVDVLGRVVAVLLEGLLTAGVHSLSFSAENLPAGVYVVRAEPASGPAVSQTITILR